MKIAIVNSNSFGRYFPEQIEALKQLGEVKRFFFPQDISGKELAQTLQEYEYIIASVTPNFDQDFFDQSLQLKMITRHGLGYNNVDVESATKHGVYVSKVAPKVERNAVAEQSVALMMASARYTVEADQALRTQDWTARANYVGMELSGKTFGIIGLGNIGSRVAEILKNGFNGTVLAYDPYIEAARFEKYQVKKATLEELLRESDFISINASLTDTSEGLIAKEQFGWMKKEAIIVDTARGAIFDKEALIQALKEKEIRAYGADVFHEEPIDKEDPLLALPNVIVTPHIGAYTRESLKEMGDKMVQDVKDVAAGRRPKECINQKELV